MRIHVNLLSPAERRSPAGMMLRRAVDALLIVAVVGCMLYGLHARMMLREAHREKERGVAQWEDLKETHAEAQRLRRQFDDLERMAGDLAAFSNAQVKVAARLPALARCIPRDIQLLELALAHEQLEQDDSVARQYVLTIRGRSSPIDSEERINALMAALRTSPSPLDFGRVTPGGIRVAAGDDQALMNIFEIRCTFPPVNYQ